MRLEDINIYDVGNKWGLMGAIFGDEDGVLICMLPDTTVPPPKMDFLEMNDEDWHKFLRQSDLLEMEVLSKAKDGKMAKAIMRKTQRVIESRVSWAIYQRDGYKCRYCGREGIPLTVDHVICWEEGGPSIPKNLVAACRRCNKTRGRTEYLEWLQHPYYKKASKSLSEAQREENRKLAGTLSSIPRRVAAQKR